MAEKKKPLTPKEALFAAEYVVDFNCTAAAKRAGYSDKHASKQGWDLVRRPHVLDEINRQLQDRITRVNINQDWVLYHLQMIVHRCLQIDKGPNNKPYQFNAAGANKALEMIGRHLQMFTDNIHIDDLDTILKKTDSERIDGIIEILNTARTRQAGGVGESAGNSEQDTVKH